MTNDLNQTIAEAANSGIYPGDPSLTCCREDVKILAGVVRIMMRGDKPVALPELELGPELQEAASARPDALRIRVHDAVQALIRGGV